jgi:hypothetical protein
MAASHLKNHFSLSGSVIMKLVAFVLPFGRSRLLRSGDLPSILIRASGCAAVGLFCLPSAFRAWSADCVSSPAGLVGWWPGAGNANDIASPNNGTLAGDTTYGAGRVGQGFVQAFDSFRADFRTRFIRPFSSSLPAENVLASEEISEVRSMLEEFK